MAGVGCGSMKCPWRPEEELLPVVSERHDYLPAEIVTDLVRIEAGLCDGFPQSMYSVCLDKLTGFKLFKEQCLESRSALQNELHLVIGQEMQEKLQDVKVDEDEVGADVENADGGYGEFEDGMNSCEN